MPKVTGKGSVNKRLSGLAGQQKVALVGQALFAGGERIKATASRKITEGAVSGKNHVPSRPGQPPNENTGHLRTNIKVYQVAPLRVQVVSEANYSAALEYGTSKMAARPFMGPSAREESPAVKALVNKAIDKVLKG